MDELVEKLGGILSDPESMQQLSELAQMLMSGGEDGDWSAPSPDLSSIMKLGSLAGALTAQDPKADLLLALKPHLGLERQKRVDKAVKLLRLIALWQMAKENGLLSDII